MQDTATAPPYELLYTFMLHAKHQWLRVAERNGLSLVQLHAIALLMNGGIPMVQLSSQLVCDASYVTGIVDRLEESGLVERRENVHDRRIKMIVLTEKGRTLRDRVQQHMTEAQTELLSRLNEQERQTFYRLMLKIIPETDTAPTNS